MGKGRRLDRNLMGVAGRSELETFLPIGCFRMCHGQTTLLFWGLKGWSCHSRKFPEGSRYPGATTVQQHTILADLI